MTMEERNAWILENQDLVYSIANKYVGFPEFEDICQEGFVGAIIALDRLDENKPFSTTYIHHYISGYILQFLNRKNARIHIPEHRKYGDKKVEAKVLSLNQEKETNDGSISYMETLRAEGEPFTDDVIQMAAYKDDISKIKSAKARQIFTMLGDGKTINEIRDCLHITRQGVYAHIIRNRNNIECLKKAN